MAIDKDKDLYLNSIYDNEEDVLTLIMKDVKSDTKSATKIKGPKIDIYIDNDTENKIYKEFILTKNAEVKQISYKWKEYEIAKILGFKDFAEKVREGEMQKEFILMNKRVFGSDINIQDFYIMKYLDNFPKKFNPVTKKEDWDDVPPIRNIHISYMDYEWDIAVSDKKEEQPIYMGTYIDGFHNVCYTYYLDRPEYARCGELSSRREEIVAEMLKIVDEDIEKLHITDLNKKELVQKMMRDRVNNMTFILKPYKLEKDLLIDMMQLAIRNYKPDFLLIFNASSDIEQIELRAQKLRIKGADLFTCPELGNFYNFNYQDNRFNPKERNHTFDCASYTKILCSMNLYYKTRSGANFASYNLSDTVYREIGIRKLGYGHICDHISELPYKDYVVTYMYNVRDVLVMVFLEDVLKDVEMMMTTRFLSRTEYNRAFIPSAVVTNSFYHIALRNGKVQQPNINLLISRLSTKIYKMDADSRDRTLDALRTGDPVTYQLLMDYRSKEPVEGGLCSDPNMFVYTGNSKKLNSFLDSWVLEGVIDMDAKSMYPNNIITSNIGKSTLFGRITKIDDTVIKGDVTEVYRYVSAMFAKDWINIGHLLFGLPSLNDVIKLKYNIYEDLKVEFNEQKFLDTVDLKSLTKLNGVLKHLFKEKLNQKDLVNINTVKMNNSFIISDDENVAMKYNGTKVRVKLINTETTEPLLFRTYLGFDSLYVNSKPEEWDLVFGKGVYVKNDKVIKVSELNDSVSCNWDYTEVTKGNQVGTLDISSKISTFKTSEELIKMNVNGVKVDLTSDIVTFNSDILKEGFLLPDEDGIGDIILLNVFETNKTESDNIYMCEIKYNIGYEEGYELSIEQRFLVCNY